MAQVVEDLPGKLEVLSQPPSTTIQTNKQKPLARHRWLTPVILAIQEAEIRRISI
jgi:hypothetical protein